MISHFVDSPRRGLRLALAFGAALALLAPAAPAQNGSASGRVIVLGFDGADARTVDAMMQKGELPNLARLRDQGTFAPLGTTNPAESPVAWASLNSGRNPAETAIPGFVMRKFGGELGEPGPIKGFAQDGVMIPIEEFAGTPIPTWSAGAFAAAIGGGGFVLFLLVFGVLLRLKRTPTLVLSLVLGGVGAWGGHKMRGYLPAEIPVVKNPLQAAPFWEIAAKAGVKARVIDGQQAWDRAPVENAKVLCGLGVPDARGSYMSFTIYTTDELYFARKLSDAAADTGSGGYKLRVDERDGVIDTEVFGPDDFWSKPALQAEYDAIQKRLADEPSMPFKKSLELDERRLELEGLLEQPVRVPMHVEIGERSAKVTIGSQTQELAEGAWSDWYRLTFEFNPLLKLHAVTRAKIVSLSDPCFELYLNTVEIDPAKPPFWQPISQPADFSAELATSCGTFETVGWACLTHPFKDDVIDAITFLQDIEFTTQWRERLVFDGLKRDDWRLFVGIFSEADRVQHMMYQYYDPEHPLHDAAKAAARTTFYGKEIALSEAIPAVFRKIDEIVGRVMNEHLGPQDTLMLCADHGFQSFRRQVHLNNWLASEGFLTVRSDPMAFSLLGSYVDWSKTQAYALGLGSIYLNLEGSETQVGIVKPDEREALSQRIIERFLAATDPQTGARIGRSAQLVSKIHSGPYQNREADIAVGFEAGYRVSWTTTSGGMSAPGKKPGPFVSNNDKNWSGDHVSVDTDLVRGMFFCNRKCDVPAGGVDLLHIAPTALDRLGVAVPSELDVPPLVVH
jgi:predicted AlkP superfamily phosphohydrolase/phosphomutase